MKSYYTDEEKKLKIQAILLSAILSVLLILGLWINLRQGVYVGEDFLHRKSETLYQKGSNTIEMVKQSESAQFETSFGGVKESAVMTWTEVESSYGKYQVTVTFDDGEACEGVWGRDSVGAVFMFAILLF